jgi:hypothetical protein
LTMTQLSMPFILRFLYTPSFWEVSLAVLHKYLLQYFTH